MEFFSLHSINLWEMVLEHFFSVVKTLYVAIHHKFIYVYDIPDTIVVPGDTTRKKTKCPLFMELPFWWCQAETNG